MKAVTPFPPTDPVLVRIQETGKIFANRARVARSPLQRGIGLLNRASLEAGEGLVLPHCSSVHMFFMRFAIDVVFCAGDGEILAVQTNLKPWRLSRWVRKASFVIELPAGTLRESPNLEGSHIEILKS